MFRIFNLLTHIRLFMKIQFPGLFLFFLLTSIFCFPQNAQIDSLKQLVSNPENDSSKVNTMLVLSSKFYRSSPAEAIRLGNEAKELAEEINFKRGLAYALKSIGMGYYFQGNYIEVLIYWQQSLETFQSIDDKLGVANMLNNLGAVHFNEGGDTKAVEYYLESLKVSEEIGDTLRIATALVNIGAVYFNKKATHQQALEYYFKALPLSEALGDQDAIGTSAVNMGEIYLAREELDSARFYFEKALSAYTRSETGNVTYALNSLGKVYARTGKFTKAINFQEEAFEIASNRDDQLESAISLLGLAETYTLKRDIPSAIKYYRDAMIIGEKIGASYELKNAYEGLALSYAELNNYDYAYKYQMLFDDIKDTLYNAQMDKRIHAMTLSFDLDKKQGEVDLLTKDRELQDLTIQKQKFTRNALIVGIILVLVIAFITFRNYLNKVRINKILDKQKVQIENLLLNILPAKVAKELQLKGKATPRDYESVSVLFTDFKGFTKIAEGLTPNELVTELNTFFQAFDSIVEKHELEKIKTIGDAYMCAGGIPTATNDHFIKTVKAGLEMQEFMFNTNEKRKEQGLVPWELRVGIHTGPVVAGVVGKKKYAYDIWGNTVNIASRMESNGETGKVNISSATYQLIKDNYSCHHRGKISAKNVGEIDMYFIENEIAAKPSVA